MKTVVLYFEGSEGNLFDPTVRDNCNDPFICLKNKIDSLGYKTVVSKDADDLSSCAGVFFFNSPFRVSPNGELLPNAFYDRCLAAGLQDKLGLLVWEGPSVKPENYAKGVFDKFRYIFTWRDEWVDNKKFFKFYLPITSTYPETKPLTFSEKKLLVNISRKSYSPHPDELYSEREKTIRYFGKHFPNDFDLFGFDWNRPENRLERLFPFLIKKIPGYRGSVSTKSDILPRYKFSLCYENIKDHPGYVTEKIFDSLRSGTVPIYWGAPDIASYVDPEAFIDRRQFKTDKDLADFILFVDETRYQKYTEASKRYLQSDAYKLFLPEHFSSTLVSTLGL